jgi:hypothetical protein
VLRFAFEIPAGGDFFAMEMAGLDLPPSAVALLASRLHHAGHTELAMGVGLAIDTNSASVLLNARERARVLRTLEDCPRALIPLRDALVRYPPLTEHLATVGA